MTATLVISGPSGVDLHTTSLTFTSLATTEAEQQISMLEKVDFVHVLKEAKKLATVGTTLR